MAKRKPRKTVETLRHSDAQRKNIPTAEYQALLDKDDAHPIQVAFERRNRDLDPQLVWRGKDEKSWSDLVVQAPPLFIQEKVHPKVLIDDLARRSREIRAENTSGQPGSQIDLFADFNGLPNENARTEFYQHDANWSNRMILGDSLQVMASLAEREGLRGKVQCIYIDPPYGIKFNSNFQWSTTSRDVRDGKKEHISREPEQVKAFRDTWRDGIHSYLTYLRDRLTVARDLLTESGSVFVQIGDDNVHRVRGIMDEVFGESNYVASVVFRKTTGKASVSLDNTYDVLLWFAKCKELTKIRDSFFQRHPQADHNYRYDFTISGRFVPADDEPHRIARMNPLTAQSASPTTLFEFQYRGRRFRPGKGGWKTNLAGMERLSKACRLTYSGETLGFVRPFDDFAYQAFNDIWDDTRQSGFGDEKVYVVQTATRVIQRCVLMATDPGDLVLDPTCGSGTTPYVAEQWGRRWIAIDTSRVALVLARARIMGARYSYYLLADSPDGQRKEGEIARRAPTEAPTSGDIRHGFVYERVPHIKLKSIANNAEIDIIWARWQETLEPLRSDLNARLDSEWEEWQVPNDAVEGWSEGTAETHRLWWEARIARQREIDSSIAAAADYEYLYDRPYEDNGKVRVAGPFTVESLSPHRVLNIDEDDELMDVYGGSAVLEAEPDTTMKSAHASPSDATDFAQMALEHLKAAGVHQAHKDDRISFSSVAPWPGHLICAEGIYFEGKTEKRAGIFIGPEFGTVARADLVEAAREAADAAFDVLIACAFNYEAHATELHKLGRVPVLKARMNADLHMADDLKNTGKGNLFVVFGEPDIDVLDANDGQIQIRVNGVDVFHPSTGEIRSDGAEGIACWFIDTDYNEESFFVRHAYFLGASDPYKALQTTLKAEIDPDAWKTLHSDTSRPFDRPESGRIAVKVINHLGDEVMKVFRISAAA